MPDGGLPLALTMGEPAGIGGELALAAWARRAEGVPPFFVLDDPDRLRILAGSLGWDVPIAVMAPDQVAEQARAVFAAALPVVPLPQPVRATSGHPTPVTAAAVMGAIETAVALVRAGQAGAVVTNPVQKETLYAAGFRHPGQTEFLGALAGVERPIMMLAAPELRVVPVTVHIPLAEVPHRLTAEAIVHAGRVTHAAMRDWFGIATPRLAVAGLNPHAGEGGSLGREEETIIAPALAALQADGIAVRGPVPPDALFTAAARPGYDAALCMYHDQALIPLKALAFDDGVNLTLGLPFVRTSPDHGTALDIAGTGKARPDALLAALRLGQRLASRAT
ncbi:4-hydroxythreonine-4-phosphate dehydrogenase PdxA [Zavarzinia sp. CC-PAN008]